MPKLLIDAGHGGTDSGATGTWSKYGGSSTTVLEKDLNLSFAQELATQLGFFGVSTILSRNTDKTMSIDDRSLIAHNNAVDGIISIHFNSADGSAKGLETFYAKTRPNDKAFADVLQKKLVDYFCPSADRGVKDDTLTYVGSLGILRNYDTDTYPRALIEVEFIDNYNAMTNTIGYDYYERMLDFCYAVTKGVRAYFNIQ